MKWIPYNKCYSYGGVNSNSTVLNPIALCTSPLPPSPQQVTVGSAPDPSASVATSSTSRPLSSFEKNTTKALEVNVYHQLANRRFYSIIWSFDSSLLKKWSTNTGVTCFVKNLLLSCGKKCLKGLLAYPSFALLQLRQCVCFTEAPKVLVLAGYLSSDQHKVHGKQNILLHKCRASRVRVCTCAITLM